MMPTVVSNGSHFGGDVDDDAAVLPGLFCELRTKTTSALLKEGGEILGHDERTHRVRRQGGNYALKRIKN